MLIRYRQAIKLSLLGVLLGIATLSHAAEIKNVQFNDSVTVDQYELKIKGVAILKWAMLFDVYAGAFYLPDGAQGRSWSDDLPKSLELSYFREITGADFAETSYKLLQRNLTKPAYQAVAERLRIFCNLFQDIKPGDRYSLNYTPGTGTELRLNGLPLGSVPGADFAVAYFGIWLGDTPINDNFRDRLLAYQ
jgi:hypothetical protein